MTRFRLGVAVFLGLVALGCVDPQTRQKAVEESERDKDLSIRIVGDITDVSNVAPLPISGVGLVTGLNGTGGSPPPANEFRRMLKDQLLKRKVPEVERLLESRDHAMVLVSALIPAGARKGDQLDIDVTLPVGSKATSLRGGFLEYCELRDFDTTKHLKPDSPGGNRLLMGYVLAKARGPLLVGFANGDEPDQLRQGRIWAGSVCDVDRPFSLILRNDSRFLNVSNAVAQRINFMFQDNPDKRALLLRNNRALILDGLAKNINEKFAPQAAMGHGGIARALNKESVSVNVPYAYRFNAQRYLRVVRLIPLQDAPEKMDRYRHRLEKMLLDPEETVRAALRLEALGKESIRALKRGLESEHPLVRFSSAEALTYLGSTVGCEHLTRLVEQYPLLRSYGLLALAGLEENVCRRHLCDMLAATDAELRCGAFQALRLMDENDRNLNGERLNNAFWLHQVAPGSTPLVYFAVRQRAEIILFGSDIRLVPPGRVLAGTDFVVGAEVGDDRCTITHFQADHGSVSPRRRQCSLRLDDILHTMVDMGAQYADAVGFLTKAEEHHCLSCPVRCRSLPQEVSVEMLAQSGKEPDQWKNQ